MKHSALTRVVTSFLVTSTLFLVSGCGFHLRGAVELAPELQELALAGVDRRSELGRELETALARNGGRLVASPEAAGAVLIVKREQVSRRVLSVAGSGQASEYELNYRLDYRFEAPPGTPRGEEQSLTQRRYYRFDPTRVLAKADEEARLVNEMRRDAIAGLLRRLNTLLRQPPPARPVADAPAP
jgi:LPS-assembly lipoprotein